MKTFISHSTKDADLAQNICNAFEEKGMKCFIAPRDINAGCVYSEEIMRGIDLCDAMVLIASKSSFEYFIMLNQWIDASASPKLQELINVVCLDNKETKNAQTDTKEVRQEKKVSHTSKGVLLICILIIVILIGTIIYLLIVRDNAAQQVEQNSVSADALIQVGDQITMGIYNGVPITWTVLFISDMGYGYALADQIVTIKPYDSPESGVYNQISKDEEFDAQHPENYTSEQLRYAKGNNEWGSSNIRSWLNSEEVAVSYIGTPPSVGCFYDDRIGYNREPGFLTSFSEEELQRIVETNGEYVFLPSQEEIALYVENNDYAFAEAMPTPEAFEQEITGEAKGVAETYDGYYPWFTRSVDATNAAMVVTVIGNDFTVDNPFSYSDYVTSPRGIRPAMWISIE